MSVPVFGLEIPGMIDASELNDPDARPLTDDPNPAIAEPAASSSPGSTLTFGEVTLSPPPISTPRLLGTFSNIGRTAGPIGSGYFPIVCAARTTADDYSPKHSPELRKVV